MSITLQSFTTEVEFSGMKYQEFVDRFIAWKEKIGITNYGIEKAVGYSRSNLTNLEKGLIGPSDDLIDKLVAVPNSGLTVDELKSWRAMGQYEEDSLLGSLDEIPTERILERLIKERPDFDQTLANIKKGKK